MSICFLVHGHVSPLAMSLLNLKCTNANPCPICAVHRPTVLMPPYLCCYISYSTWSVVVLEHFLCHFHLIVLLAGFFFVYRFSASFAYLMIKPKGLGMCAASLLYVNKFSARGWPGGVAISASNVYDPVHFSSQEWTMVSCPRDMHDRASVDLASSWSQWMIHPIGPLPPTL